MSTSILNPVSSVSRSSVFDTLGPMFVAGFFATLAFDFWGQVLSPVLGLGALSPHGLARSLLDSLGLPNSAFAGYFVHFYLVGLIAYPVGWLAVFKPAWMACDRWGMHWSIPAVLYGFGLWVFAIGGITVIAGLPFFLGFATITWVALIGHMLYGVVLVAVMNFARRR